MRARLAAVGVAVALSGCGLTPGPEAASTQTASPHREALQYFPVGAPVVALVRTDPTEPGVRRLLASGVLDGLARFADGAKLRYAQYRSLLGNAAAVGQPVAGGPPLAVLVTRDAAYLDALAESRVRAGLVLGAGTYRGATIYQSQGFTYAVRGPVLLAGRTVAQLRDALDIRTSPQGLDPGAVPAPPDGTLATGRVDLRALLTRLPATWRPVPLLAAVRSGVFTVRAEPDRLAATLQAPVELRADDLPGRSGPATVRVPRVPRPVAGVADLGKAAVAAERAVRTVLPVSGLRIDAVYNRLRAAGVELTTEFLRGPAWTDGRRLLWRPADPAPVADALARVARRFDDLGIAVRRGPDGFYDVDRDGRLLARIGFDGRTLVAGRGALGHLARAPEVAISGGTTVLRLPRTPWLPAPLQLALDGAPDRLTVRARTER